MGLAECRDCGNQVSVRAPACPSCGAPGPAQDAPATPESHEPSKPKMGHKHHFFMTFITCGLWLPVWLYASGWKVFAAVYAVAMITIWSGLIAELTAEQTPLTPQEIATRAAAADPKAKAAAKLKALCEDDIVVAYLASKKFIKRRLKSPSTAKFPWSDEAMVSTGPDCTYTVRSYVDSQNGFGAMIRSNYVANLKRNIDDKNWSLVSVNID